MKLQLFSNGSFSNVRASNEEVFLNCEITRRIKNGMYLRYVMEEITCNIYKSNKKVLIEIHLKVARHDWT